MMFLIRSAFWLTVAFVAMHPKDMNLGAAASAVASQAAAAGQQVIVSQLAANGCLVIRCPDANQPVTSGLAELASSLSTSTRAMTLPIVAVKPVVPRPRPAWMG
jgi:hypothetical protein